MLSNRLIKPLLARDVNEDKLTFPCYMTSKIDGSFAFVQNGLLYARSLKHHENKYVTQQYSNPLFEGLRGELILGNDPTAKDLCRNTSSALRRIEGTPETSLWCFDYITHETVNLPYSERRKLLEIKVLKLRTQGFTHINFIYSLVVNDLQEYLTTRNHYMNLGYEGIVIRNPDSKHKEGRSSEVKADLWRWKPEGSAEIRVTKLVEEMKNNNEKVTNSLGLSERSSHQENLEGKNTLGAIVGELVTPVLDHNGQVVTPVGTEVTVSTGSLTEKECKELWDKPDELVGHVIEFTYMSFGLKDKPRFPRVTNFKRIRSEVDL